MNIEEFGDRLSRAASGELKKRLKTALVEVQMDAVRQAVIFATARMRTRTGALRGSIRAGFVKVDPDGIAVSIRAGAGSKNIKYARIQELGGTIKGKPYLRIPMEPALTGSGVDRYSGKLRTEAPGVFRVVRTKKGKLFLVHNETNEFWYVLKRSVKIKGKHYLKDGLGRAAGRAADPVIGAFKASVDLD